MTDILLTPYGDLNITEFGDITLTESVRQAVRIRLLWFFSEWRLGPEFGVPYFEEFFIKNPNIMLIRSIVREQVKSVDDVIEVRNLSIDLNKQTRLLVIRFIFVTSEETYREEVMVPWPTTD